MTRAKAEGRLAVTLFTFFLVFSWTASAQLGSQQPRRRAVRRGRTQLVATAADPEITAIIGEVDADRIKRSILRLEAFGTRHSCSPNVQMRGVNAARDWIFNQFSAIPGLQVRLDSFTHSSCPTAPTFNVVAWLPGTRHPERLIVVGGHYDSRTVDVNDAVSDAPGANDAGSQTALVLECARVLAGHSHDSTLFFAAFSGEEQGLIGSTALAGSLNKYVSNAEVVAMLNSDIVGGDNTVNGPAELHQFRLYSPGTPRELFGTEHDGTTDNTSPSRGLMRYVGTVGATYVPTREMIMIPKLREDRPGRGSDHRSFIRKGFPAVRFMETVECSPSPPDTSSPFPFPGLPANCLSFTTSHQHSPNDISSFVTPDYTARVAQVVAATAASLARATGAPSDIEVVGNSQGATIRWAAPVTGGVDHFVIAARSVGENFYRNRVNVPAMAITRALSAAELGLTAGENFFISVAAVDTRGHESLFAYPEFRCDALACVVPPGALNIAAPE